MLWPQSDSLLGRCIHTLKAPHAGVQAETEGAQQQGQHSFQLNKGQGLAYTVAGANGERQEATAVHCRVL